MKYRFNTDSACDCVTIGNKMKIKIHAINGFKLHLEYNGEWIESLIEKGEFTGSLSMAEHLGTIENDQGQTMEVPQNIINAFWIFEQTFSDQIA